MSLNLPLCHDLLQFDALGVSQLALGAPDWVRPALGRTPWGVVRRVGWDGDRIAVGVRGPLRSQRHAGWVEVRRIQACFKPAELMLPWHRRSSSGVHREGRLVSLAPQLSALFQVCAWHDAGPGGSWGFELASGQLCTHAGSDLDLVVRLRELPAPALAAQWQQALQRITGAVRADALLELPIGGLALAEVAGLAAWPGSVAQERGVMLRGPEGPEWHTWGSLVARARGEFQASRSPRGIGVVP